MVRVRIINTLDTLALQFKGPWLLGVDPLVEHNIPSGANFQFVRQDNEIIILDSSRIIFKGLKSLNLTSQSDSGSVSISDVPYGVGWWWTGTEDRVYDGKLHIYMDAKHEMNVTIQLLLEKYLKGVIPYEIGGDSPMEALKAQAVAARSEAVIALTSNLYSGEHHDLTSDVECQVFSGNKKRTAASDAAVDATRSIVISEHQQPINAYYASNCGGRAELIKNVWPDRPRPQSYQIALPDNPKRSGPKLRWNWRARRWIRSSPEVFCNPEFGESLPAWSQRNFRWKREFSIAEVSDMLGADQALGTLKKIKVLKRGISGRISKARFIFEKGVIVTIGELKIRQLFSPSLRSANFYVEKKGDLIILKGAGWGHGVGMCQTGAVGQALLGIEFEKILLHYYPEAELLSIYDNSSVEKDPVLPGFP
ncbi:SpoIID/LytB domain-containing protein [bacterium]|nr:SpoIID/LytB domain-containing protein [bacterium]